MNGYRVPTVSPVIRFVYSRLDYLLLVFSAFSFSSGFQFIRLELLVIIYLIMNVFYYIILEGFHGATLSKIFFDVIVIDEYGEKINSNKSLPWAFLRLIPFIEFSFLIKSGRGWHDKYTDTYVINKKDLKHIKEKIHNPVDGVYTYNEF